MTFCTCNSFNVLKWKNGARIFDAFIFLCFDVLHLYNYDPILLIEIWNSPNYISTHKISIYLFSPGKNVSNYNKKVQYLYQIFGSFTSINAAKFFVRTSSSGDTSTTITFYRLFKYWVSIKVRILERTCRYYMHMFFIIIPVIFSTLTQWNKTIFCSI